MTVELSRLDEFAVVTLNRPDALSFSCSKSSPASWISWGEAMPGRFSSGARGTGPFVWGRT